MAVLREQGKLSFDDPLVKHVPEFGEGHGGAKDGITLEHLLTHTHSCNGAPWLHPVYHGWEACVKSFCEKAPLPPGPGKCACYCNSDGFATLAMVVQRLSGQSFQNFADEHLLKPLGLEGRIVLGGLDEEQYRKVEDSIAECVFDPDPNADLGYSIVAGGFGSCGMRMSAVDFAVLGECLLRGGAPIFKDPKSVEMLVTKVRSGMYDMVFEAPVEWGRGFACDWWSMRGVVSALSNGHGGIGSSMLVLDPPVGISTTICLTGVEPDKSRHFWRIARILRAVWLDVGATPADRPINWPLKSDKFRYGPNYKGLSAEALREEQRSQIAAAAANEDEEHEAEIKCNAMDAEFAAWMDEQGITLHGGGDPNIGGRDH